MTTRTNVERKKRVGYLGAHHLSVKRDGNLDLATHEFVSININPAFAGRHAETLGCGILFLGSHGHRGATGHQKKQRNGNERRLEVLHRKSPFSGWQQLESI